MTLKYQSTVINKCPGVPSTCQLVVLLITAGSAVFSIPRGVRLVVKIFLVPAGIEIFRYL